MNTSNGCVYLILDDRCQATYDVIMNLIRCLDVYQHSKDVLVENIDWLIELLCNSYGRNQ